MKLDKRFIISLAITLVAIKLIQTQVITIPSPLKSFFTLVGFSLASLGITEFYFGNKNRRFTFKELFIDLGVKVLIIYILLQIIPVPLFSKDVLLKQAFSFI